MAAVLACGQVGTAVLSHRSAAAAWELLPAGGGAVVDVTVAGIGGRGTRDGIRLHRSRSLTPDVTTRRLGIPVTTPPRTIADLRRAVSANGRQGAVSRQDLRRAIRRAEVLGLPLGDDVVPERTRSELEHLFLGLCRRHGIPRPEVNVRIGDIEVDFLWRDRRLVVETDGYRYHRGRAAFEDDRKRGLALRAHGYEMVRLSHRQVTTEPKRVVEVLEVMLAP